MARFKKIFVYGFFSFWTLLLLTAGSSFVFAQTAPSGNGIPTGPGLTAEDCAKFPTICNPGKTDEFRQGVLTFLNYFLTFLGLVAVVVIIYAGVRMVISAGNESKVKEGQKMITYAVMGLLVVFLSFAIVNWVVQAPSGGNGGGNTTTGGTTNTGGGTPTTSSGGGTTVAVSGTLTQDLENLLTQLFQDLSDLKNNNPAEVNKIFNRFKAELDLLLQDLPKTPDIQKKIDDLRDALDRYRSNPSRATQQALQKSIANLQDTVNNLPRVAVVIRASTGEGPTPLTVQFDGSGSSDPSGNTIPAANYSWWYFDSAGTRVELGTGPIVSETFRTPNSYVVHLRVKSGADASVSAPVLAGDASITIRATAPLATIKLKVGSTDVSGLETYRITLPEAQAGVMFDPVGSLPQQGFEFTKTEWDFGDSTPKQLIDGAPIAVTHTFKKLGRYRVSLSVTDNGRQTATKILNLEVVSAVAVLSISPKEGTTDTPFRFSAEKSTIPSGIKESLWKVEDNAGNILKEFLGDSLSYQFDKPGIYKVTLTITDNDGNTVQDSGTVKVASKPPMIVWSVKNKDPSHPNRYVLDATGSYDSDEGETLSYRWLVDGEEPEFDNTNDNTNSDAGAKKTYTFKEKGTYTVRLELTDSSGNTVSKEQKVTIDSTLNVDVELNPVVVQVGKESTVTAKSEGALFYRYDFGDGKKEETDKSSARHSYDQAGVYTVKVTVFDRDNNDNTATTLVYVGDANTPMAVIQATLNGEAIPIDKGLCGGRDGITVSRIDSLFLDASLSINRDGTNRFLDYSWNFGDGTVSTKKTIIHKFTDTSPGNDCYAAKLTVTDRDSNKSATSAPLYVHVGNKLPTLQDMLVTAPTDALTPVVVNVSALGAKDPDGKITSYKWYYYEEGGDENFGTHLTNRANTTFTIPSRGLGGDKVKYHFVVEMTDNDNATVSSEDILGKTAVLTVTNRATEPLLLDLSVNKNSIKAGDAVEFTATAKDSRGNTVSSAKIAWDFNGDGQFEDTTSGVVANHTFSQAGNYQVTARVDYQGVTSRASVTVSVNPSSSTAVTAAFLYTVVGKTVVFQDNSTGTELTYQWDFDLNKDSDGDGNTQNDTDANQPNPQYTYSDYGTHQVRLTVRGVSGNKDDVVRAVDVKQGAVPPNVVLDPTKKIQAILITLPEISATDNKLHLTRDKNRVTFFSGYSTGTIQAYRLDTNIYQDSDKDGIADNDIDNQGTISFTTGSSFTVTYAVSSQPLAASLTVVNDQQVTDQVILPIVFDDVAVVSGANSNNNFSVPIDTQKQEQIRQQTDALLQQIDASALTTEQKNTLRALITKGDTTSLQQAQALLANDTTLAPEAKASLMAQIQSLLDLKGRYIDLDSAIQRIKFLIADAEPVTKIKINRSLLSVQENYGIDATAVQQELGAIQQAAADSTRLNDGEKEELRAILLQIGDSLSAPLPTNDNQNKSENVNENLNQNVATETTNENANVAVPVPTVPGETPLWVEILWGVVRLVLWIVGIFLFLGIVLFGSFITYKKISNQEDLDFEEFILDLRSRVTGLFTRRAPEESAASAPAVTAEVVTPQTEKTDSVLPPEPTPPEAGPPIPPPVPEAPQEPPAETGSAASGSMPDWLTIGTDTPSTPASAESPKQDIFSPATPEDKDTAVGTPATTTTPDIFSTDDFASPPPPPGTDIFADTPAAPPSAPADTNDIFANPPSTPPVTDNPFGASTPAPTPAPDPFSSTADTAPRGDNAFLEGIDTPVQDEADTGFTDIFGDPVPPPAPGSVAADIFSKPAPPSPEPTLETTDSLVPNPPAAEPDIFADISAASSSAPVGGNAAASLSTVENTSGASGNGTSSTSQTIAEQDIFADMVSPTPTDTSGIPPATTPEPVKEPPVPAVPPSPIESVEKPATADTPQNIMPADAANVPTPAEQASAVPAAATSPQGNQPSPQSTDNSIIFPPLDPNNELPAGMVPEELPTEPPLPELPSEPAAPELTSKEPAPALPAEPVLPELSTEPAPLELPATSVQTPSSSQVGTATPASKNVSQNSQPTRKNADGKSQPARRKKFYPPRPKNASGGDTNGNRSKQSSPNSGKASNNKNKNPSGQNNDRSPSSSSQPSVPPV